MQKRNPDVVLPPTLSTAMPTLHQFIRKSLVRPPMLFFTEPIVFALIYLLTAAVPAIGAEYGLKPGASMLVLVFVGSGLVASVLTRLYDRHVARAPPAEPAGRSPPRRS